MYYFHYLVPIFLYDVIFCWNNDIRPIVFFLFPNILMLLLFCDYVSVRYYFNTMITVVCHEFSLSFFFFFHYALSLPTYFGFEIYSTADNYACALCDYVR